MNHLKKHIFNTSHLTLGLFLFSVLSACGGPIEQTQIAGTPTAGPSGSSTSPPGTPAATNIRVFEGRYLLGNSNCSYTLRLSPDTQTDNERAASQRSIMHAEFHSTGTAPECNYSETNLVFRDKLFAQGSSRQCVMDSYGRYGFVYVSQPENFYLQPAALQAGLGLVLEWTVYVRSQTGANPCQVPGTSVTPEYTRPGAELPTISFLGCDSMSDRSEGSTCLQPIGPLSLLYSRFETMQLK